MRRGADADGAALALAAAGAAFGRTGGATRGSVAGRTGAGAAGDAGRSRRRVAGCRSGRVDGARGLCRPSRGVAGLPGPRPTCQQQACRRGEDDPPPATRGEASRGAVARGSPPSSGRRSPQGEAGRARRRTGSGSSVLPEVLQEGAKVGAGAEEPRPGRVLGDAEDGGNLGRAEVVELGEQEDVTMVGRELGGGGLERAPISMRRRSVSGVSFEGASALESRASVGTLRLRRASTTRRLAMVRITWRGVPPCGRAVQRGWARSAAGRGRRGGTPPGREISSTWSPDRGCGREKRRPCPGSASRRGAGRPRRRRGTLPASPRRSRARRGRARCPRRWARPRPRGPRRAWLSGPRSPFLPLMRLHERGRGVPAAARPPTRRAALGLLLSTR